MMTPAALMVMLLLTAASYFYFHWQYFALVGALCRIPPPKPLPLAVSFLSIFLLFNVCTILEMHLVANWALFFLALLGATMVYRRGRSRKTSLFFTLSGIYYGLSVNIFSRCVIALVMNRPLSSFDNNVTSGTNLKPIPILLGFLLAGAFMSLARQEKSMKKLRLLLLFPDQISFLIRLLLGLLLYLFLNLLLYQTAGNDLLLKLWGLKSSFFSAIGFYLGLRYALRMCELQKYREETYRIQRELPQKEREGRALSRLARRDPLTGCYNRSLATRSVEELLEAKIPFALCFIDLNRLKYANDHFGHAGGDRYLAAAARQISAQCRRGQDRLFRYGGDEFLLLLPEMEPGQARERMEDIAAGLAALGGTREYPFPMALSYGVCGSWESDSPEALIQLADHRMYLCKQKEHRGTTG